MSLHLSTCSVCVQEGVGDRVEGGAGVPSGSSGALGGEV